MEYDKARELLDAFEQQVGYYVGHIQRGGSPLDTVAKQHKRKINEMRTRVIAQMTTQNEKS